MCADRVRETLDEECGRAHAVALTQASEFGSTQRIEERCAAGNQLCDGVDAEFA